MERFSPAEIESHRQAGVPSFGADGRGKSTAAQWLRGGARRCKQVALRSCLREFWELARSKSMNFASVEQLAKSLSQLSNLVDEGSDNETPIFVLATGWRTGSTLLQRILATDPHLLLWGEPLGDMALVPRIAEFLCGVSPFALRQDLGFNDDLSPSSMATSWIANLYPPSEDFRRGLRSLFDHWLAEPARKRGFARWGFKEVRLGATEASLLHWLYPRAKFLVLSRHPYDCYRSLSDAGWRPVFWSYPNVRVDSAVGFARHWNRLVTSWSELPEGFPSLQIKYEDLVGGRFDFLKLESWLGVEIRETVALSTFLGSTAVRDHVFWHERLIIAREAARGMQALGYSK